MIMKNDASFRWMPWTTVKQFKTQYLSETKCSSNKCKNAKKGCNNETLSWFISDQYRWGSNKNTVFGILHWNWKYVLSFNKNINKLFHAYLYLLVLHRKSWKFIYTHEQCKTRDITLIAISLELRPFLTKHFK